MAGPYNDPDGLQDYYREQAEKAEQEGDQKKADSYQDEVDKLDTYKQGTEYNEQSDDE